MSPLKKKRHHLRSSLLIGVGFFLFVIFELAWILIEWKKNGFIDPMNVLLVVFGTFGLIVNILWIKLLIRMQKRGELED